MPKEFESTSQRMAIDLINKYSLATVVTTSREAGLVANHFPLITILEGETLKLAGHMAKANFQWQLFSQTDDVLAIFHGPHSYISSSWYMDPMNVPTWNYVTVHAYGRATIIEGHEKLKRLLDLSMETFERSQSKHIGLQGADDFISDLMNGIIGFEIQVKRLQTKLKLSQNRNREDREGVMNALSENQDEMSRDILDLMRKF